MYRLVVSTETFLCFRWQVEICYHIFWKINYFKMVTLDQFGVYILFYDFNSYMIVGRNYICTFTCFTMNKISNQALSLFWLQCTSIRWTADFKGAILVILLLHSDTYFSWCSASSGWMSEMPILSKQIEVIWSSGIFWVGGYSYKYWLLLRRRRQRSGSLSRPRSIINSSFNTTGVNWSRSKVIPWHVIRLGNLDMQ